LGKLIYGGSKVIDLYLKLYKMFLSNITWYKDDLGVKMHRIIVGGDKKINRTLTITS
jgi:hypothetical protein